MNEYELVFYDCSLFFSNPKKGLSPAPLTPVFKAWHCAVGSHRYSLCRAERIYLIRVYTDLRKTWDIFKCYEKHRFSLKSLFCHLKVSSNKVYYPEKGRLQEGIFLSIKIITLRTDGKKRYF